MTDTLFYVMVISSAIGAFILTLGVIFVENTFHLQKRTVYIGYVLLFILPIIYILLFNVPIDIITLGIVTVSVGLSAFAYSQNKEKIEKEKETKLDTNEQDGLGKEANVPLNIQKLRERDDLARKLGSTYISERKKALKEIGRLKDRKYIHPLIYALDEINFIPKKEKKNYVVAIRKALVNIGQPAVGPLIKALKHDNVVVIVNSILVLGEIGDHRALKPLAEVENNHEDKYVRRLASKVYKKINKRANK